MGVALVSCGDVQGVGVFEVEGWDGELVGVSGAGDGGQAIVFWEAVAPEGGGPGYFGVAAFRLGVG